MKTVLIQIACVHGIISVIKKLTVMILTVNNDLKKKNDYDREKINRERGGYIITKSWDATCDMSNRKSLLNEVLVFS